MTLSFETNGTLQVRKESANTAVTNGDASYSLAGAEFKAYEDPACTDQAKDSNGTAVSFTTDASGNTTAVSISAGTYYMKETKAPENFKMDETVYPVTVESSSEAVVIIRDTPVIYGGVKVKKADTQGSTAQGDASLAGAEFTIYNASGTAVKVIMTGSDGVASTEETDLTEGSYTVQETKAPVGYKLNPSWKQSFTISQHKVIVDLTGKACEDTVLHGGVKIQKNDADLKKAQAQGDADLSGAVFTITNKSSDRVYVEGKWHNTGAAVKTITTNAQGVAQTSSELLPYGTYEIAETSPSAGYRVNSGWKQTFQIRENGKIINLNGSPCEEPVIRGGVRIKKQDNDYKDDIAQGDATLKEAEFTIKNKSKASVVVGGKEYAVDADVITIKTNDQGIAETAADAFPYGTYEIRETTPSEGYLLNEEWKQTFEIRENGKIVDLTGEPCNEKVIRGGVLIENVIWSWIRMRPSAGQALPGSNSPSPMPLRSVSGWTAKALNRRK